MKRILLFCALLSAGTVSGLGQDIPFPQQYIEIKPIEAHYGPLTNGYLVVKWWAEPYFKYRVETHPDVGEPPWPIPPQHEKWRWLSLPGWMAEHVPVQTSGSGTAFIRVKATANEPYLSGGDPWQGVVGTAWYQWLEPLYSDVWWKHLCYSRELFPMKRLYLTPWGLTDRAGWLIPTNTLPPIGTWGPGGQLQRSLVIGTIGSIIDDLSRYSWREIYDSLTTESAVYKSTSLETNFWTGTIITEPNQPIWIYVRSDDGARVTVNGLIEHDTFGLGQPWDNVSRSFAFVCCLAGGTTNRVRVDYSNIHYGGQADSDDGITLFLIGDNPPDGRITGQVDLDWYGADGSEEFTYWLDAHAANVTWQVSSNLVIVHQDPQLRTVDVSARGASLFPGADWVRAQWTPACGGTQVVANLAVTVFKPTAAATLSVSNWLDLTAHRMGCRLQYQMLDQFGGPFPFTCLVSEQTWTMGLETPPEWDLTPDAHDENAVGGRFRDRIESRIYGRLLIRGQVIWAHRTPGAQIGVNIRYNRLRFDAPVITVEPINAP